MSYLRSGWPHRFVMGDSVDYVFVTTKDYKSHDGKKKKIEDYNSVSDEGLVEMLFWQWETDDKLFKDYFMIRLAERLNVKLRKEPLTVKEQLKIMAKNVKKFN